MYTISFIGNLIKNIQGVHKLDAKLTVGPTIVAYFLLLKFSMVLGMPTRAGLDG